MSKYITAFIALIVLPIYTFLYCVNCILAWFTGNIEFFLKGQIQDYESLITGAFTMTDVEYENHLKYLESKYSKN